jgi:hypothetical protein
LPARIRPRFARPSTPRAPPHHLAARRPHLSLSRLAVSLPADAPKSPPHLTIAQPPPFISGPPTTGKGLPSTSSCLGYSRAAEIGRGSPPASSPDQRARASPVLGSMTAGLCSPSLLFEFSLFSLKLDQISKFNSQLMLAQRNIKPVLLDSL